MEFNPFGVSQSAHVNVQQQQQQKPAQNTEFNPFF